MASATITWKDLERFGFSFQELNFSKKLSLQHSKKAKRIFHRGALETHEKSTKSFLSLSKIKIRKQKLLQIIRKSGYIQERIIPVYIDFWDQ